MRRKARVTGSTSTKSKPHAVGRHGALLQRAHQRRFAERGTEEKFACHCRPHSQCQRRRIIEPCLHRRIDVRAIVLAELDDLIRRRRRIGAALRREPSAHEPVRLHRHLAQLHQIGDAVQDRHAGRVVDAGMRQQRHHHAAGGDHHLGARLGIRPRRAIELRDDPLARGPSSKPTPRSVSRSTCMRFTAASRSLRP